MMERKAHLISDLKYLLATLPLTYPVTVDIKNMDSFIKHLISIKLHHKSGLRIYTYFQQEDKGWEMDMISEGPVKYPEWFKLERGTEKTVNRLSRIEELRFYLRSPDQYFRRLAILRINQLRLKDGISYLEEMLDNDLESELNKKLAAWTIKSICLKWNVDLFISNRLFYQFSGKEQYDEMYSINIEDSCPPLHLKIPSSPVSEKITRGKQ